MAKIRKQDTLCGKYVLSWFRQDDPAKKEKPLRD